MTTIQSVSGPLETQQLGRVLMHEHVFILDPDFLINYPELDGFDEARHVPDAIVRLNELKAGGIDTIVDLTVLGIGRNIARIATVQAETDLQILVATGLYTFNEVPHVIHIRGLSYPGGAAALLTEMFVGDINEGIAGTGVRAAILKCATDAAGGDTRRGARAPRRGPGPAGDGRADQHPHARAQQARDSSSRTSSSPKGWTCPEW